MSGFKDLSGQRFGRLSVLGLNPTDIRWGNRCWDCRCDCGTEVTVASGQLRSGKATSCGCYNRERTSQAKRTHGMSESPEFHIWTNMMTRCLNPHSRGFRYYGGRGMTICDRWRNSFAAFYEDMGPRPGPRYSVDRIDNDGPYAPENCRWADWKDQARNKRSNRLLTHAGKTQSIQEWANETGLPYATIYGRVMKLGWRVEDALTRPRSLPYARRSWASAS